MKKILYIVLGFIFILFIGAFVAAKFIPIEKIQAEALKQAKDKTGLDIAIDGSASLSFFPSIALETPKVTIKKPNDSKQLASIESLNLVISLSDLIFSQQVRIERLELIKPDLYLEKKKSGSINWSVSTPSSAESNESEKSNKEASPALAALFVNKVEIKEGKLTYFDASTNKTEVIDHLNFELSMPSLSSSLTAEADFNLHGQKTDFNISLKKASALYEKEASDLKITLKNNVMSVDFAGTGQSLISDARELKGDFDFETNDLPGLLQWTSGKAEKSPSSFTKVSKKGKIQLAQNNLSVNPLKIEVDDYKGEGSAIVSLGGAKPNAKVTLTFNNIAIDRMIADAKADKNLTISALEELFVSKVAFAENAADDEKIDLSVLDSIDGTFKITIANLSLKGESLGQTGIDATLAGGRLNSHIIQNNLFKGKADLTSNLTSTGNYAITWTINDVDVNPLLTLFKDFKKLSGTAMSHGSINMTGQTKKQLTQSMSGNGSFQIQNGAVQGIDLGAIAKDITKLFAQSNAQTQFSSLSTTFTISNGRVTTNDLTMKSPMAQLTGAGYVDLPSQNVNMRIVPKFSEAPQGQQGKLNLSNLTIPFIITGTFDNLTVLPDVKGTVEEVLKNPEALGNQINNLLGKKGGKKGAATQEILNGILGGGSSQPQQQQNPESAPSQEQPSQKKPASQPVDILNQLLGQ